MIGDLLHTWISETGQGATDDLRSRLAWLARMESQELSGIDTGRWLRDMSSLGHCEVDWKAGAWSVAPPVISRLPLAGGLAILVGARRPALMKELETNEIYFEQVRRRPPRPDALQPATILLPFDRPSDLESAAEAIGARYVGCFAVRMAQHLPDVMAMQPSAPPPYDALVERLEGLHPRTWLQVSSKDLKLAGGLYREQLNGRWQYLFRRAGDWYACDLAEGVFADLARTGEGVIRWRPDSQAGAAAGTVFVDWGAPLPPLHARTLTLCSGFVPRFSDTARTAIFENVPYEVARRVCATLRQPMQTID